MKRMTFVAALLVTAIACSSVTWAGQTQTVMVPMRDGVKLATSVFLPGRRRALARGPCPDALQQGRPGGSGWPGQRAGIRPGRLRTFEADSLPRASTIWSSPTMAGASTRMDTTRSNGSPSRTGPTARSAGSASALPALR